MALFTTADRDAVKAAYLTALTEGIASANIGGQHIVGWTVDQWKKALDAIQQDISTGNENCGMRFRKMIPGSTG
jgi:hypothetical protein